MDKKSARIALIKRIVTEELVSSQEELIAMLADKGVAATQSTLSRDFKEINISKMPHPEKGYVYVLSDQVQTETSIGSANIADAVYSLKFSGNIAVITTKSGYASAVSVMIDTFKSKFILGTIAGDNVVAIIMEERASRDDIRALIGKLFPLIKM